MRYSISNQEHTMKLKASFLGFVFVLILAIHTLYNSLDILSFFTNHKILLFSFVWCTFIAISAHIGTRPRPILLLDYSCFKPDSDRRCSLEICEYFGRRSRRFSETSAEFMRAIYQRSGLGDETYGPPFIFQTDYDMKHQYAVQEAEESMFSVVQSLFSKTCIDASKITHLVAGCSMFSPSPSLSSLIVHRFGLDERIKSYNLSGMGCSVGAIAMDLASRLLSKREIGYVLIVVTESTSLNWYFGDDRHMLVTNCIFRVGTAAALITNDPSLRHRAKMELLSSLRTHHGADDASYNAAMQQEDKEGNIGVALTKDLVRVAGMALKNHISTLAPRVLPLSELLKYVYNGVLGSFAASGKKETNVPDFTKAFRHICIHAGGKAVINSIKRIMGFDEEVVEPARMSLHRFGNTSSSLVFYELAYFEAKKRIQDGDKIWMLGFGTGFKACSVVWRALKKSPRDPDNPWNECIHRYPV